MALLLALCLVLSAVIPAAAIDGSQSTGPTTIKADVLYWEDNELVVKEFSGHQERLVVTPETKIEGPPSGRLKAGDKIVAQITNDRRALSITLQIPDAGTGGPPTGSRY